MHDPHLDQLSLLQQTKPSSVVDDLCVIPSEWLTIAKSQIAHDCNLCNQPRGSLLQQTPLPFLNQLQFDD